VAGAFVVSAAAMFTTIIGIGHLSDVLPFIERVHGVQTTVVMITVFTLVLFALFTQRRESEAQLAKKGAGLLRLHDVSSRLWLKRYLGRAFDEILVGAIELLGADKGIIRILDPARRVLKIEAQRGFKQEFIDSFREVSAVIDSPCVRTLRSGERIVIADFEEDELFTAFRPRARSAGGRAIIPPPIRSRHLAPLATLTTHFDRVCQPAEQALRLLDRYVQQAAAILARHKAQDPLR